MPEFVTSDGATIHYEVEGRDDGPPLVLSNSLGTNLSLWDGQVGEANYRGFRLIRYDQRGHGASSSPPGPYTIERLATDVLELLDELGIEQASFCGISLGGMTGIQLAKHHPRRFRRVAVCNTTVWMPVKESWTERITAVESGGMAAVADAVVARWFGEEFRGSHPDEIEAVRGMLLATEPAGYAGCVAAIRDMDLRDQLGLIESPVLVVIGSRDQATTPEQGQYIVGRVPGAQKIVLDAGHISNIEQRDAFNQAVFDFLAGERL